MSEHAQMESELRSPQLQRDRGKLEESREVLTDALNTIRDDLSAGGVDGGRKVLRSLVNRTEVQKERATLWYTFPLLQPLARLYSVPPGVFDMKVLLFCNEIELRRMARFGDIAGLDQRHHIVGCVGSEQTYRASTNRIGEPGRPGGSGAQPRFHHPWTKAGSAIIHPPAHDRPNTWA